VKTKKKKESLGIKCTASDCEAGLHCFRQAKKRGEKETKGGRCRECGADLVDWSRVHKRKLDDVHHTFDALKNELIRHHFWHREIDLRAVNNARRKGREGMKHAAERRIRKSVGPAEPAFDGRQTGKSGNPLFYAQHSTATCCRKCIEYWHGIPQHRELTESEVSYFAQLLYMYIEERLPNLTEHGEKVPGIRNGGSGNVEDESGE
jgi:hypothetical protein